MSMTDARANFRQQAAQYDFLLLGAAVMLTAIGLVMVLSASGITAEKLWGDKYFFFRKQAVFAVVGFLVMAFSAAVPKRLVYSLVYVWLILAFALLGMATFSSLGIEAGGSRRWVSLGLLSFQPLELAKVALALYLAYFYSRKQDMVKTFSVGFIPPVLVTGLTCLLLMLQPDFGGAMTIAALFLLMSLVGGTRFIYLCSAVILASASAAALIVNSPYRMKRWLSFMDPFENAQDIGYQLVQSLYALGSGGWTGVGLGAGKQKLFFLPQAHNDFILAVVGEELGFLGMSLIFACVGVLLWRGIRIAMDREDIQDRFTAFGLVMVLGLGILLNLAVVLGAVPPKGVPMPFMSYGGSSLIMSFACVGLLLNLSRR